MELSTLLREILIDKKRPVSLGELVKDHRLRSPVATADAIRFLLDTSLAIRHEDGSIEARPAEPSRRPPAAVEERPVGVLPRMSERCREGGLANGRNSRAKVSAKIGDIVRRAEKGEPLTSLVRPSTLSHWRIKRRADWQRIMDAAERSRRLTA